MDSKHLQCNVHVNAAGPHDAYRSVPILHHLPKAPIFGNVPGLVNCSHQLGVGREIRDGFHVNPILLLDISLRIMVAIALGAAIGLKRQWRLCTAGIRTNALVSVGSVLFVALGPIGIQGSRDPALIPHVSRRRSFSGIGFLGPASFCGTVSTSGVSPLPQACGEPPPSDRSQVPGCSCWRSLDGPPSSPPIPCCIPSASM